MGEDAEGWAWCTLVQHSVLCSDKCELDHTKMSRGTTLKGLHELQKWRRNNGKKEMPHPYVIGKLIDSAIYRLRNDVVYD